MEVIPSIEKVIQMQFDSLAKKALRGEASDIKRQTKRRGKREVLQADLPRNVNISVVYELFIEQDCFYVQGYPVVVHDERLAKALMELPEEILEIVLLYFFLDMTDQEIADLFNMDRSSVNRKRNNSLIQLQKILEELSYGKKRKNKQFALLPYSTIKAATQGDVDAIQAVLNHYSPYILKLSSKTLFDENGDSYFYIDEEKRHRLEIKLITIILQFDVNNIK